MPEQVPKLGDNVSVMFDGKVTALFTAPDGMLLISVNITTKKGSIITTVIQLDNIVQILNDKEGV